MIEMIAGVFGLAVVNGASKTIKAMDKNSGPFEASAEQEARLVSLGLAKYVDCVKVQPPEEQPEAESNNIPSYDADMSAKALRELGREHGLSFPANMSKVEMVEELDKVFLNVDDYPIGFDEQPPEDYEDAPKFDPAEAVE